MAQRSRAVFASSAPAPETPREIAREFRGLLDGGLRIRPAGAARDDPEALPRRYGPRYKIELFDTTYYLADARQNPDIRFFVAYVRLGPSAKRLGYSAAALRGLYPRIFYKDVSLVWRAASHFIRSDSENWIGKGDVRPVLMHGELVDCSAEDTTDLPLEIQTALETLLLRASRIRTDHQAVEKVLRRGPDDRIRAYADFTAPRDRARATRGNLVNGGRPIAGFRQPGDPASLVFEPGFEPDFADGIVETSQSRSTLYGGELRRFRIVSRNREIQYLFMAGPRQAWIIPPQATSTEITSYGVRAIDVMIDEDLCVPGYEYHFMDDSEDPPVLVSQIPERFVGESSPVDPDRADASPWLEQLPVIQEFRRRVLGGK